MHTAIVGGKSKFFGKIQKILPMIFVGYFENSNYIIEDYRSQIINAAIPLNLVFFHY